MKKVHACRAFPRQLDLFFKGFKKSEVREIFQDLSSYPYDDVILEEGEIPYIKVKGGTYAQDNALGKLKARRFKIIEDC